ncbi:MAG: Rieske (2Fe-2S) protein [Deltaproteobacteria bacterium]|nr:Rieske (2Fe-2S) protein [Deltaproteobacteria bacterium]
MSQLLAGTLLTGVAGALGSTIAFLFPPEEVSSTLGPRRVKVASADEMLPGEGKLMLVDEEPVWVVRRAKGFAGLSAWCTHKGCVIKWDEQSRLFRCPCHEGQFDERGNVISGLPLRPLARFRVGVVRGEVYVSRGDERSV